MGSYLPPRSPRARVGWDRIVSASGMAIVFVCFDCGEHGRVRNDDRLPSRTSSSCSEAASNRRTVSRVLRSLQRFGRAEHMDRESSQSPRERRYDRRRVEPSSWWFLVGTSPLALPMGTITNEEVVPGLDAPSIHDVGETSNSADPHFNLFWLLSFRLGRPFLDGRHSCVARPGARDKCAGPQKISSTRTTPLLLQTRTHAALVRTGRFNFRRSAQTMQCSRLLFGVY